MREIAQEHREKLKTLKGYVEDWHAYWKDNNQLYNDFMTFVFKTSLGSTEISNLKILNKPAIEFNVCEAYISRLRGEFAMQQPTLTTSVADGIPASVLTKELVDTADVVEGHIREVLSNTHNDGFEYNAYSSAIGGGFSVAEVYTDYINSESFEQTIFLENAFDPTLCGFDPLARESHKGDGKFCFKIVPKTKEEFIEEYGEEAAENIAFTRSDNVADFNWSYLNQKQEIVLIACIWVKEGKKKKLVKLSNGKVILKDHYVDLKAEIDENGVLVQAPIILEERWTTIENIVRYDVCETKVLGRYETNYKYLPLVFIDGNSVMIKNTTDGPTFQMIRPYIYHAKGIQKLKNFAGQTIANEIETMVQHKWVAAVESVPPKYEDAYKNPQQAQTLLYYAYDQQDPSKTLPAPREVQRTPTPPIVEQIFAGSDKVTQAILGSYDATLGVNSNDISGKAIMQGALHSNAAALPYLMGYYKGLNRIATILLDLIPKYYVTPRSLPIRKANGMRDYQIVNDPKSPNSINLRYDPNSLQIKIEVGVSTELQQQIALEQLTKLIAVYPAFAKFMDMYGIQTVLDNLSIRGVDDLKLAAKDFMEQLQQEAQAAANKPNPMQEAIQAEMQVEGARIKQKQEEAEGNLAIKQGQLAIDKQKADTEMLKAIAEIEGGEQRDLINAEKANAELARQSVELAMDVASHANQMTNKNDEMP